jgi:HSP20 family protein
MTLLRFNNFNRSPWNNNALANYWGNDVADFAGQDFVISVPAINIFETETAYRIDVAAPGLEKENFDVVAQEKLLTILSKNNNVKPEENGRYNRKEFNFGNFKRTFSMPDSVDLDGISASYTHGILEITLPKKKDKQQNRNIQIS